MELISISSRLRCHSKEITFACRPRGCFYATAPSKIAIVTGGSSGIGKAVAHSLAAQDFKVAVIGRDLSRLHASLNDIPRTKHEHIAIRCDVSSRKDSLDAAAQLAEAGEIHVLVNSAGITLNKLLLHTTAEDFDTILRTNLYGSLFMAQAVLPHMLRRRSGCIINIGSVVGRYGNAGQVAYSASKAALIGATQSLAKEVGSRGVRVNMISPGFIDSEMTRTHVTEEQRKGIVERTLLRRLGTAQDVVVAVEFLLRCEYIVGQDILVDGGLLT